ncbi:ABC transporter permease [Clostridium sp. Marseille-P299]|uniref:ABC transporter permease n=1 Tax=Clostridium sp. Marseille-P299 TaxID=1805477 RepID=UPI000830AC64|nr:ABC transporter permease [Clostridium sp. Marseille-P299]
MKFYVKKIITLIITLLLVSMLTFIAFQVIPGDSALSKLGIDATEEQVEALREAMGLNKSIPERYINFVSGAIKGDFGNSSQYSQPVTQMLKERLPVTLWLAVLSIVMVIVISIPLGILSARKEDGFIDRFVSFLSQVCMAIPPFFLGIMLTLLFGIILKWFVPGKYVAPNENFLEFIKYLFYPALAVSLPKIAMTVKFLRSSILRELHLDYVRTAKSKGSSGERILWRHVLKNALIPVITFMGMVIADLFAGSIVIEQVFNLPGLGRLLVVAISNRDFNVVQAAVLYIAAIVIFVNFIVDILYQVLDPRVRIS